MPEPMESNTNPALGEAAKQVEGAHALLKVLEKKIGQHPELGQVIHKLEVALNILGVKTGAML